MAGRTRRRSRVAPGGVEAASDATDSPKSPFTTANRARALELLGRFDEAEAGYLEALQLAEQLRLPPVCQYAQVGLASLALERGALAEAGERLAQADQPAPASPGTKVALLRSLVAARLALRLGQGAVDGPVHGDKPAIGSLTGLVGERAPVVTTVMALLARAEAYRQAGQREASRTDVDDALALAERLQGRKPGSLRTGLPWLQRARALAEQGERAAAGAAAQHALRQFEAVSVADAHPAFAEARALAGPAERARAPG